MKGLRKCRIAPIYNGPREPFTGARSYHGGAAAAANAVQIAESLAIPAGVRIYADLERRRIDPEWIRGWCEFMYESRYAGLGGVYGNSQANDSWGESAVIGAEAAAAKHLSLMRAGAGRAKAPFLYIWSNRTPGGSLLGGDPPEGVPIIATHFNPAQVRASPYVMTTNWQYRVSVPLGTATLPHGIVDLDLSTEPAYAEMWH